MQLGFAHGPFEAEQQPVVELSGVIDAVFVQDQSVGQGADLEQPVPVRRVAGQAGDLQAEHHADLAHAHGGDQTLEAFPVAVRARLAQVAVDDDDLVGGQPRAMARSRSAYWRLVLSVFSNTWRKVLWRTYR